MKFKTLILLGLIFSIKCSGQTLQDYKSFLVQFEGYKHHAYLERGNYTVGIGHNLTAHRERVKPYYNDNAIDHFFEKDIDSAIKHARNRIVNFDNRPEDCKLVIISLIFNCGNNGFDHFADFLTDINHYEFKTGYNYKKAAYDLLDSKWYYEIGNDRAEDHFRRLFNIK